MTALNLALPYCGSCNFSPETARRILAKLSIFISWLPDISLLSYFCLATVFRSQPPWSPLMAYLEPLYREETDAFSAPKELWLLSGHCTPNTFTAERPSLIRTTSMQAACQCRLH